MLGIERFKRRYTKGELDEAGFRNLFSKDRFFAVCADDTNVSTETAFDKKITLAREKYDDAIYLGDKSPRLYRRFQFLRRTFLACRVVFMLRDPFHVARSWQIRADNPGDRWGELNGYKTAIDEWNAGIAHATASIEMFRDDLIIVSYEELFLRRSEATIAEIFSLLHLDPGTGGMDGWHRGMVSFLRESRGIASSTREVPDEVNDFVRRNADFKAYEELSGLAVAH